MDEKFLKVTESQKPDYTVIWGGPSTLIFDGVPNESETGEVTYTIHTNFKCKRYVVSINGTPFINGEVSLDTVYQAGNDQIWYKAGDPFIMQGAVGAIYAVRFKATSGPITSSQCAGTYTAKLSVTVLSFE